MNETNDPKPSTTFTPRPVGQRTTNRIATLKISDVDREAITMLLQGFPAAAIWKHTALGTHVEFLNCLRRVRKVIGVTTYEDMMRWLVRPGDELSPSVRLVPAPAGIGATAPAEPTVSAAPERTVGDLRLKQTLWGFTYTRIEDKT